MTARPHARQNSESRAVYVAAFVDGQWITTRNGSDIHIWPNENAARNYVDLHASIRFSMRETPGKEHLPS